MSSSPTIRIQSLVEAQDAPTVVVDREYRIVAANAAYCASYGVQPGEIVGRRCHEVSHHSAVPCHQNGEHCPHHEVFRTQSRFEVLHTHYDQHNHADHVRIKAYPLQDTGGATYLMETIHRLAPSADLTCEEMKMVGRSPSFLACIENMTVAARSDAPVLLYGETGVGKELAARFVHDHSARKNEAFVELNCAAIPEALTESELFGHERGAFTGCLGRKQGLFELASGGTLFLDEIGELPLAVQAKLLRVLDAGEFRRVGGHELVRTDARVIAATNQNLLTMVADGRFREDLYFRIAGIKVNIPPLRERRQDIPALAETLLQRACKRAQRVCRLTKDAIDKLVRYDYPGNIRELRNVLQRAAALSPDGVIHAKHIHLGEHSVNREALSYAEGIAVSPMAGGARSGMAAVTPKLKDIEARYLEELLARHGGKRRAVAEVMGVSERTIYRRIKQLGLASA
ncbi:MAG: sigma-54-dependent Fis family transcriptional regulator [Gammaproteobacteria bacterium]|nr:MAG: sigma-54-dependent Fis family transcriptional regulator [Gammaproteobacteria bacterium]